jgi:HEAT repeat protein
MIVAGMTIGYMIAGFSVSSLVQLLGKTENLLLVAGVSMLVSLGLLLTTTTRFHSVLAQAEKRTGRQQTKSLGQLLKKRFVKLIFSYQMLSAVGTLSVIFLFINQAETTFANAAELAGFFGNFSAVTSLITILFLVSVAGPLFSRFGLSFGLTVNPGAVAVMVAAMIVVGATLGSGVAPFFWIVVGARLLDLVLTDGMTSTALKTTYQALPTKERSIVETGVEGIGVPVAFGIAGISLLIFNAMSQFTILPIILFTLVITILWVTASILVYRDYASSLLKTLSRRALSEAELSLEDGSSLTVVENMLKSRHEREVRLALDMLQEAGHESLEVHLIDLVGHTDANIRLEALRRIEQRKVEAAYDSVQKCMQSETDPVVKGAALRALCALIESDAAETVVIYLDDPDLDIRLGAMVGLLRYGGIPGVLAAAQHLADLEHTSDPVMHGFVARVIGEVGLKNFYQPLVPLLSNENLDVRQIALVAAGQVNHPRLHPPVINNLDHRSLRSTAMSALVASGEEILPLVEKALAGETEYDEETVIRLVRVCAPIKGPGVIAVLKQHLNHPDDDVQYQVLVALAQCGYQAAVDDHTEIEHILKGEVEHGLRVLLAKQDIGQDDVLELLHSALDYELNQVHKRVFLLLSFIYDAPAILRAEDQLVHGSSNEKALALETLDVTLSSEQKAMAFPLVDESKSLAERTQQLGKLFLSQNLSREERLDEIIADPQGVWTHGWTRACAIYAVAKLSLAGLAGTIEAALTITEHPIRETAAWALHSLVPEKYQAHAAALAVDTNPHVARLAAYLNR